MSLQLPSCNTASCSFYNCYRDEPVKGMRSHVVNYHTDQDVKLSLLGLDFTFKRESGGERNYVCLCGFRMNSRDKVMYHCRWLALAGVMNCQVLESKANSVLLGNPLQKSEDFLERGLDITKSSSTEQEELEALVKATEEALWEMEGGWKTNKYPQDEAQKEIENAFACLGRRREVQKRLMVDTEYEMDMIVAGRGVYHGVSSKIREGGCLEYIDGAVYRPLTWTETSAAETDHSHEASSKIEGGECRKYIDGRVVYGPLTSAETIAAETSRYHEALNRIEVGGCRKYIDGRVVFGPLTLAETIAAEARARKCKL